MKVLFMGTPEFAVPSLMNIINSHHEIVGVITTPDKPAGRGKQMYVQAVAKIAKEYSLNLLQYENLENKELIEKCKSLQADIGVVVAFKKLPPILYNIPKLGTFNLHGSILPQYRGAAPMHWAIINGETETGLTTFFINENIDTGKIIQIVRHPIHKDDTVGKLHDRLSLLGADMITDTLNAIESNKFQTVSQTEIISKQSIEILKKAPKLNKQNTLIDWHKSALEVYNHIRGLNPSPCAYTYAKNSNDSIQQIKIFYAEIAENFELSLSPGKIVIEQSNLFVGTSTQAITIKELQTEGRKKMTIKEYLNGLQNITPQYFVNNNSMQ